jgi:hypothetical protein
LKNTSTNDNKYVVNQIFEHVDDIRFFLFRYIDDALSLNNSKFGDFVDRIYPIELEIKDTTDTDRVASYLDLHIEIDSDGR